MTGPPTDEELVELSDRWRPYRSLPVSYLFASEFEDKREDPGGIRTVVDRDRI